MVLLPLTFDLHRDACFFEWDFKGLWMKIEISVHGGTMRPLILGGGEALIREFTVKVHFS